MTSQKFQSSRVGATSGLIRAIDDWGASVVRPSYAGADADALLPLFEAGAMFLLGDDYSESMIFETGRNSHERLSRRREYAVDDS